MVPVTLTVELIGGPTRNGNGNVKRLYAVLDADTQSITAVYTPDGLPGSVSSRPAVTFRLTAKDYAEYKRMAR